MTFYFMLFMMVAFFAVVIYFAKVAVMQFEEQLDNDVLRVKETYSNIIRLKDELAEEKAKFQAEADRIFNLYDLMRDSTKTFDKDEAFQAFKSHLYRQIQLEDCQLVGDTPKDIEEFPSLKGYKAFPLKTKKFSLGELVYKGLQPQDEEAFAILAHQFALALRRVQLYKDVEHMAINDSLTGLHTRRYLMERFEEEFARTGLKGLSLSLLMVDVDHFKRVNDEFGHLAGDQVLREVGRLIGQTIREVDIAGRYGGEEFCVILPDTDKQGALLAAERVRLAISEKQVKAYDASIHVTVSIGVASIPEDAHHMGELLDKADWALYRAKRLGRNRAIGFSVYGDKEA
jgi:diguanylate cyclase (GGDEF)-like protein